MPDLFFVELVQDIAGAPEFELAALGAGGEFHIVNVDPKFALIEGNWESLREAAFVRKVSKVLLSSETYDKISETALPEGKFYVRFMDSHGCHDSGLEPEIGELLKGRGRISFKNPDFVVRVYHHEIWYVCIEQYSGKVKEFESRRAPMRPFFSPISISPRHARFMVNVSGTKPGDTILDPFCGTGGILLEAGLTGRKVIGNDWALQMSTGAKLNLKYYGIRDYKVTNEDFLKMNSGYKVDAVVTDLPYGKNARLSQKNLTDLYKGGFRKFYDVLKDHGKCVVVVSDIQMLTLAAPFFETEQVFKYRVHRSLTRYFAILKRK